jgi:hypothetical protein
MANRPKNVSWILFVTLSAVVVASSAWLAVVWSSPLLLVGTVVIAIVLATARLVGWRRGIQAARQRAWIDSPFSFSSLLERMHAREAADALVEEERRFRLLGARYGEPAAVGAK